MRAPESRLERIEQIERKLVQRPEGWTTGELAREFQVDPSTIFRDLAVLESMGSLLAISIRPQRLYAHGGHVENTLRRWKYLWGMGRREKSAAALSFLYQGRDNRAYLRTLLHRTLISVPS